MWLRDPRCSEVVQESWQEGLYKPDGFPITNCLKTCQDRLQHWNKTEYGHVGQKIQKLQKQLQVLEAWVPCVETDREIKEVRHALNVWLDAESTMWRQRSRNFWLTDGDRNTRFFHTKATNRKQRNMIHGICDSNGNWQEDEQHVENIIVGYFRDIIHTQGPADSSTLIEAIEPMVTSDE